MLEFVNPENYFPVAGLVGKTLTFYTPDGNDQTSNTRVKYYEQYKMFAMEHHAAHISSGTYFGLKVTALPMIVNPTGSPFRYRYRYADNSEWKYDG